MYMMDQHVEEMNWLVHLPDPERTRDVVQARFKAREGGGGGGVGSARLGSARLTVTLPQK